MPTTMPTATAPPIDNEFSQMKTKYMDKLKQLSQMGFNDERTNIKLLERHNGRVVDVVNELIASFD
jgi:hypothetical protein